MSATFFKRWVFLASPGYPSRMLGHKKSHMGDTFDNEDDLPVAMAALEEFIAVRHVNPLPLTGRSPAICPASAMRTSVGKRTASASLFRSHPLGFVNRKMFSFRSNPALFMA
jgi:hypothetical protein